MFHTYIHRRADDGKVMYVGKGSVKRSVAKHGRNERWTRTVEKHGLVVEVVAAWATEEEAFDHEKFLISCFRALGYPLVNQTDGGDGASGCVPSSETLLKRSIALKAAYACPVRRADLSKRSTALMASEATRARQAEFSRESWLDSETRASRIKKTKENHALPKTKKLLSDIAIKRWADPEFRKKNVEPVFCYTNGVTYPSIIEAAKALGLNKGNLSSVCSGARKSCGGHKFSHVKPH